MAGQQTKMITLANGSEVGLCLTTNALVALEESFGIPIGKIGERMQEGCVKDVREFIRCGLNGWRRREKIDHAEFTANDAGDVLDEIGGIRGAAEIISALFVGSVSAEDVDAAVEAVSAKQADAENPTDKPKKKG